nr:hypothetical protein [Polyangiaceae bacterium]
LTMWMGSRTAIGYIFGALALCSGCTNQATVAAEFAARDSGCAVDAVRVQELESDRYKTHGCERTAVYECWNDTCWREGRLAGNARSRATREFGCAADGLQVRWVQNEVYRVEGCGQRATNECSDDECTPEAAGKTQTNIVIVP